MFTESLDSVSICFVSPRRVFFVRGVPTMKKPSIFLLTISAAFILLFCFTSCQRNERKDSTKLEPGEENGAESAGSPELVVYTYDAFPQALQLSIEQHMKTEFSTNVRFFWFQDTGGLYGSLYLEKEDPKADVVIGLDNTYLARIYDEELLAEYKPEGIKLVNNALVVDPKYRAVAFDFGGISLNYNSELLSNPPKTWSDLLNPEYKNQIILMNPTTSSPGRNFLLFSIVEFGESGYLEFWRELKPNILTITGGWSEGYGLYTQGEAAIILSYETSPAYHIHFEKEQKYKNIFLNDKAYMQVEIAGVVNGAPNPDLAGKLMDFIVSVAFQELIPLNQFMYPVHPDVELPGAFTDAGRAGTFVNMSEEKISTKIEKWLKDWESVMQ